MTLLKQDDGGMWVSGPLVGAIFAAVFGMFGIIYQFQNSRLWDDGQAISELKVTVTNDNLQVGKLESAIGSINQTLATVANALQGLKDANDNLKDQVRELRKQVNDLDLVLRPTRTPAFTGH